jgi:hypothetical protein
MAASIAVTNYSFEDSVVLNCPGGGSTCINVGVVPGWSPQNVGTTFKPSTGAGGEFPGGIPDGVNVLALGGPNVFGPPSGEVYQTLTASVQANTTYTLTIFVGQRGDYPLSGYTISLVANGVMLASDSSLRPSGGTFLADTITYTSGANPVELGQDLEIDLFSSGLSSPNAGGQIEFDDVTLNAMTTASPEPTVVSLLVLGLGGVLIRKRANISRTFR